MKLSQRRDIERLILATLAATSLTWCGGVVYAEDVKPDSVSNNKIELRKNGYTINGTKTYVSEDYRYVAGGGDETNSANSLRNKITIYDGNFSGIFGGMAALGGSARDNVIIVRDGTITGVVGGVVIWHSQLGNALGEVSGNKVEIYGGTIDYVSGGEIAYGYWTGNFNSDFSTVSGNVYGNTVEIYGGNVGNIIGGAALGGKAYGNAIIISGGTITGDIIGGRSESGSAYNNSITIEGNPDLSGATLWGGRVGNNASYTGNTLNINTWGITAKNIDGFSTINFNFPNQGNGTALTLTNGQTNFSGGLENLNVFARGDSNIGTGSTLRLIYNRNGINFGNRTLLATSADANNIVFNSVLNRGVSFEYDFDVALSSDGTTLTGTVGQNRGLKNDNPINNSPLTTIEVIVSGTQNLTDSFNDAVGNFEEDEDGYFVEKTEDVPSVHGFEVFGNIGGGHLNVRTNGGRIKIDNLNADLGLARTYEGQAGRWVIAPVFEYGKGNYDALLSNGVKGYGNTKYTAGGLIGRMMNNNGYYFEASARFGRAKNDFASDDFRMRMADGQEGFINATYHTSVPVFAGHIRIGQARRLNRSNLLDIYGIYSYSRQGGVETNLSLGDHYRFNSVYSSRIRIGYRLTTRTSRISRIYTGLAWQYERTSDSVTDVRDSEGRYWNLPSVGSRGSSGMLEIGWLIKPRQDNPWLVDINATGWIGHQKGATVMAKMKKSF